MKRKIGGLLLALGVALSLMAFRRQATTPDLSSPKATVRSFITALKSGDSAAIQQCVKGATNQDLLKQVFGGRSMSQLGSITNMIEQRDNDTAHVALEYTLQVSSANPPDTMTMVDMFLLVKQGETWQLEPDPAVTNVSGMNKGISIGMMFEMRPLSFAVAIVGSPKVAAAFQEANTKALEASCISNAKQIALGTLMYVQDYDELTPRKGASYVDLIYPYIKNRQTFTCPLDPKGTISYTFNEGVKGVPLSAMTSIAQTVMIYEGKAGKLEYKHEGRAVVGFMDGHCKLISPSEATALVWTVKVPQRAKPTKKKTH